MENKFEDFICYLNDNDERVATYVRVIEINSSIVKFITKHGNVTTLPLNRILKIKQRGGQNGR